MGTREIARKHTGRAMKGVVTRLEPFRLLMEREVTEKPKHGIFCLADFPGC